MGHDIRHGEIVGEEKIDQRRRGQPDQDADGEIGVTRAFQQQRMARANGGYAGKNGIDGKQKREQQGKTSEQIHIHSRLG